MDKRLLDILVCPVTKGPLIYDREHQELISRSARLAYPIRDGIPVMLEDEARVLTDAEVEALPKKGGGQRQDELGNKGLVGHDFPGIRNSVDQGRGVFVEAGHFASPFFRLSTCRIKISVLKLLS